MNVGYNIGPRAKRSSAATLKFSLKLRQPMTVFTSLSSGTRIIPAAIASDGLEKRTGFPSNSIMPSYCSIMPNRHLASTVLPDPTNPVIPSISPLCKLKLILSSIFEYVRFLTDNIFSPMVEEILGYLFLKVLPVIIFITVLLSISFTSFVSTISP